MELAAFVQGTTTMSSKLTPSVLIIDADQHMRQIAETALATHGYNTATAEDIAGAIWIAANTEKVIDLVICDCLVDQHSGLEIMAALRSLPGCAEVAAMFMSSHQTPDVILRRYDSTGSYHVKKPLDIELLLEIADRSLWMSSTPRLSTRAASQTSSCKVTIATVSPRWTEAH
jgi:DNA-binding NtrC family response regulator